MTWIRTIPETEADDRLRQAMAAQRSLYPIEYASAANLTALMKDSGIVASHSLSPDALFHSFAAFGAMMAPDLPLERRQHEMIATVVSTINRCQY